MQHLAILNTSQERLPMARVQPRGTRGCSGKPTPLPPGPSLIPGKACSAYSGWHRPFLTFLHTAAHSIPSWETHRPTYPLSAQGESRSRLLSTPSCSSRFHLRSCLAQKSSWTPAKQLSVLLARSMAHAASLRVRERACACLLVSLSHKPPYASEAGRPVAHFTMQHAQ